MWLGWRDVFDSESEDTGRSEQEALEGTVKRGQGMNLRESSRFVR